MRTTNRPNRSAAAAALVFLTVLAGCGSSGSESRASVTTTQAAATTQPGGPTTASERVDGGGGDSVVTVSGFLFRPEPLEVGVGQEVVWENEDEVVHTATADDGSFDLELDGSGSSGRHTFTEAGTYDYLCSVHESMTGQIVVN